MKRTWPLITTVALAATLLAGCSAGDSTPTSDGSAQQTSSAETTAAASGSTGSGQPAEQAAGDSGVGVDAVDTSKVLAEQVYKIPGSQDKTKFGVLSLTVKGKTMVLKMAMTPEFQSTSQSDAVSVFKMTGEHVVQPTLLDRGNLKEYSIIDSRRWKADDVNTEANNGEPVVWWGVYAAPEDDIKTVDIRVVDGMPEFTNVPIQR